MRYATTLLLVLSILCRSVLFCQAQTEPRFSHLTTRDGLSQSTVFAIAQDNDGFMWFATNDGLNRYDGYHFKQFRYEKANPHSLPDSWVTALQMDASGRLWVGTYGYGLCHLADNGRDMVKVDLKLSDLEQGNSQRLIMDLCEVSPNELWVSLENHGIVVVGGDGQAVAHYRHNAAQPLSLSSDEVRCVIRARDGTIWVGTKAGLDRFSPMLGQFAHQALTTPAGLALSDVSNLTEDSMGRLWIGTRENGLFRFDPPTGRFDHFSDGVGAFRGNQVLSLMTDQQGDVWVGMGRDGINHFQLAQNAFVNYSANALLPDALHDESVYSLYQDRSAVIWAGTFHKGLSKCNPEQNLFRVYLQSGASSGQSGRLVSAIAEDGDKLWVGTYETGLIHYDPATQSSSSFRHMPDDPSSLASDQVRYVLRDRQNQTWVATEAGLNKLRPDGKSFDCYQVGPATEALAIPVMHLMEDSANRLWVATYGMGLNLMDRTSGKFRSYTFSREDEGSISNNYVNYTYEDQARNLWVGTEQGLNLMDSRNGSFKRFMDDATNPQALGHGSVMVIFQRKLEKDRLWLGTYGGGLNLMDIASGTFRLFTTRDGLPNDAIYGILADPKDMLWLSTNGGLSRFDPETETFQNFDTSKGLVRNEFNRGAFMRSADNHLYFGGEGFVSLDPLKLVKNTKAPQLAITEILVSNKVRQFEHSLSSLETLLLDHQDHVFSVSVAALDYNSPEKNQLAYRLEGFLESWTYLESGRDIVFTNLSPGHYKLQVKGANNDGVWNEEGLALAIKIAAPWWWSVWAKLFYLALLLGVAVFVWRTRKAASEQEVNRAISLGKAEFATSVLHNIGNVLNSVQVSCERAEAVLHGSKLKQLIKAHELLRKNLDNVDHYLKEDSRGKLLPGYFASAGEILVSEQAEMLGECREMAEKISLMNDIIVAQQATASGPAIEESFNLNQVVMDALKVQENGLGGCNILIEEKLRPLPSIRVPKTQLMHIVINLVKNAREAMENNGEREKRLIIETGRSPENKVFLKISDTGSGIKREHLQKLSTFGFTTKKEGHGFGLHYCSRTMRSLGGSMVIESEGIDKGATFTLNFPISTSDG